VPDRLTPERRRELTRNALVDAATKRFAVDGFNGASLDEIADDAGFTKGAIYSNFGGKDELFLAVLERHNEQALEAWEAIIGEGSARGDLASRWADLLGANLDWFALTLEIRLYALRNPSVRERVAELERASRMQVARLIAETASTANHPLLIAPESLATIGIAISAEILWRTYLSAIDDKLEQDFIVVMARAFADETTPSRRTPRRRARPKA